MNHSVQNHSKVFTSVLTVLMDNAALWNTIIPMQSVVNGLKGTNGSIFTVGQVQKQSSKGISIDKKALRILITGKAITIIGGLQALALATGNNQLYDDVNYNESELNQMSAINFYNTVEVVIANANLYIADLPTYNVPATVVTSTTTDNAAYLVIMPKTRDTIQIVKNATKQLTELVKKGMMQLTVLEKFMLTFKTSEPEFFAAIKNASKLVNDGIRHNKFTGKVEKNGVAVPGATLKVVEDNKETVATWDGEFEIEGIHTGKFTVVVSDGVTEKVLHDLTMRRGTDLNMVINMAA